MRISDSQIYGDVRRGVADAATKLQAAQQRATAGQRLNVASDDPIGAAQDVGISVTLRQIQSMKKTSDAARLQLSSSDQALQDTVPLLVRAKELAIQGASAGLEGPDRALIARETQALQDAMLRLANQAVGGIYTFAGTLDRAPPFLADGTYLGNSSVRQVEGAPGSLVPMNLPGSSVFNVAGGSNILSTLQQLTQALGSNDVAGIEASMDALDQGIQQVAQAQAQIGGDLAALDQADASRVGTQQHLRSYHSSHVDDDASQLLSELVQAQSAYQAAISEAVRILSGLDNALRR